jgi:hypothetical protein
MSTTLSTPVPSDQGAYFDVLNGWPGLIEQVPMPPLGLAQPVAAYTIMDDGAGTWTVTVPDGTDTAALGDALAASQPEAEPETPSTT